MNTENGIKEGKLDNKAIGDGVYIVELSKNGEPFSTTLPLYIGESVYTIKRCGEHLYNFFKDPAHFGLKDEDLVDSDLVLSFSLLESAPINRKEAEIKYVRIYKSLTQLPTSDWQIGEKKVDVVQSEMLKLWGK